MARLNRPGWLWLNTKMVYPRTVTHPSTNRARCRATTLIKTNALPLSQAAKQPTVDGLPISMVTHQLQVRESSPVRDWRSTTEPHCQPCYNWEITELVHCRPWCLIAVIAGPFELVAVSIVVIILLATWHDKQAITVPSMVLHRSHRLPLMAN